METKESLRLLSQANTTSKLPTPDKIIGWGLDVINLEAKAVSNLNKCINQDFVSACKIILSCTGKVVVIGMGKSGHIANKIAATLASTGTSAFFVHPAEAIHGDLGMIDKVDIVLALSNSGETKECLDILPAIKRLGTKLICFTGNKASNMAKHADCHIEVKVEKEACSLGLAPTSSTTASLVLGDALAVSLLNARGFSAEDFARSHPGGRLGRNLLVKIKDVMHIGEKIPKVTEDFTVAQALPEISKKRLGITTIVSKDDSFKMLGVFTDGDLRRLLGKGLDVHKVCIKDVMTACSIFVSSNFLAAKALQIMEKHKILVMPVIDDGKLVGAFNMHDLFRAGVA